MYISKAAIAGLSSINRELKSTRGEQESSLFHNSDSKFIMYSKPCLMNIHISHPLPQKQKIWTPSSYGTNKTTEEFFFNSPSPAFCDCLLSTFPAAVHPQKPSWSSIWGSLQTSATCQIFSSYSKTQFFHPFSSMLYI